MNDQEKIKQLGREVKQLRLDIIDLIDIVYSLQDEMILTPKKIPVCRKCGIVALEGTICSDSECPCGIGG